MAPRCYPQVSRPRAWLAGAFVVMMLAACLGAVVRADNLPDFSDPEKGFSARGTALARRLNGFYIYLQDAVCNGELTESPDGTITPYLWWTPRREIGHCSALHPTHPRRRLELSPTRDLEVDHQATNISDGSNKTCTDHEPDLQHPGFGFCDMSSGENVQLVISSPGHKQNLLSPATLRSTCALDERIRRVNEYEGWCALGCNADEASSSTGGRAPRSSRKSLSR